MVATSMHYIIGILIAYKFGYKDNKKYWIALFAALPDIDGILLAVLLALRGLFDVPLSFLEASVTGVTFFAHRGISHSLTLLALAILLMFIFKVNKQTILVIGTLWASHLFMDFMTAWKFFPFLPLSFQPAYFAVIEVFDSMLTFITTILLAFFVAHSILRKESKKPLIFAYIFMLIFGLGASAPFGEFSIETIFLSQLGFWIIVILSYVQSKKKTNSYASFMEHGVKIMGIVLIAYLSILTVQKLGYAAIIGTNPVNVEPLEEFAFNYNAHTYEINKQDHYEIGIISWKGFEEQTTVPKIINEQNIDQETINEFYNAYEKSLHVNWFNHPVFTFHIDKEQIVYANVRYAKTFLENPHMPGPNNGMDLKLNDQGILISYRDGWFD